MPAASGNVTVAATARLAVFCRIDAADRAQEEVTMDRDGMPSALPRLPANRAVDFRRWPIAVVALVVCVCAAPELGAQTVIGGTSPDVQVDLGVLDSLGPEPTLPELLRRQLPTGKTHLAAPGASHRSNTVSLHAPRVAAKKKHTVAAHAPSKKPKSKAAAHAVAAVKPAAPIVPAPSPPPTAVVAPPLPPAAEAAAPPQTPATTAPPAAQPLPGPRVATAAATAAGITPAAPAPADAALAPAAAMSSVPAASGPSRPMLGVTPAAAPAAVAAGAMPNRIIFAAGAADLPDAARNGLDALAQRLTANP